MGQLKDRSRPAGATVREPSQTASPDAWRRAVVVRIPAGTACIASVNEPPGQAGSVQCRRALRHRILTGRPSQGRCLGRVVQ